MLGQPLLTSSEGLLEGHTLLQAVVDARKNLSGDDDFRDLGSPPPLDPPVEVSQSSGSPEIVLCRLHQDPAQPLGALLGESAMVGDLPRLEGGRAEPGKGDEVLFVREPVHIPNFGQDEQTEYFPNPRIGRMSLTLGSSSARASIVCVTFLISCRRLSRILRSWSRRLLYGSRISRALSQARPDFPNRSVKGGSRPCVEREE